MSLVSLHNLTIKSFHEGLVKKTFSALEVTQAFFKYIKDTDPKIGAYLSLNEENAIRDAEQVDLAIARDETISELAGVPLAIKDNILIKDLPATAASKILENYTASYDATVIQKLRAEKAVFLGKTNLDEFAMGSSTENSAFKITKNPHDHTRVPGGSSGGSCAAVAAHMAVAALGSDTGSSIRLPASFCGVVGLKPTYGAVSRSGLIAMTSSLDQIGPITKTVEDATILFRAISGVDPLDATSAPTDYDDKLMNPDLKDVKCFTIGLPKEYFIEGLDKDTEGAIQAAIKNLESLGIKTKPISLPHTKHALSTYYIIVPAEVSANLARFDGIRYARNEKPEMRNEKLRDIYFKQRGLFGEEAKRRIILGTFVLSSGYYDAYYLKAQKVRALIKKDFEEAFKEVDVILTPVSPTPAFKIGEKTDDPLTMYLSDIFMVSVNLAGLPAISIPVKKYELAKDGLPVGFQLIGKPFREADILGIGQYYEKITA
jgi:aspartyl-tRNA(Asn)/glutamyl-tRNA(Gln) amidotransferase subunit A